MDDTKWRAKAASAMSSAPEVTPDLTDLMGRIGMRRRRRRVQRLAALGVLTVAILLPPVHNTAYRAMASVLDTLTGAGTGTAPSPSFTPSPGAEPGWAFYEEANYAITVQVPDSWIFVSDPTPNVTDPRLLFGSASFPISAADACDWLPTLPTDGAIVWVEEWFDVNGLGGSAAEFPTKPAQLTLASGEPFVYDCGPNAAQEVYRVPFQQNGRYFWGLVALGSSAPLDTRLTAEQILSGFSSAPLDTSTPSN